jgi:hypothetical protein
MKVILELNFVITWRLFCGTRYKAEMARNALMKGNAYTSLRSRKIKTKLKQITAATNARNDQLQQDAMDARPNFDFSAQYSSIQAQNSELITSEIIRNSELRTDIR